LEIFDVTGRIPAAGIPKSEELAAQLANNRADYYGTPSSISAA